MKLAAHRHEERSRNGRGSLEQLDAGLTPVTEGWFVVNVRDAAWVTSENFGDACTFEDEGTPPFGEIGFTVGVLQPGKPSALYHRESNQEDFLILAGECLLLIECEERPLEAWDFVHCPPETEHILVGAGDSPCVIFISGGRTGEKRTTYPPRRSPSATARAPRRRRACLSCLQRTRRGPRIVSTARSQTNTRPSWQRVSRIR